MSNLFYDSISFDSAISSSESAIQFLLSVSAIGSAVVIFAVLLQVLLSRFVSAKWVYVFWILVVARFVLFVVPESPTSFLNLITQPEVAQTSATLDSTTVVFSQDTIYQPSVDLAFIESENLIASDSAESAFSNLNAWHAAFLLWLGGVGWAMISLVTGYCRVKKLVGDSVRPSDNLIQLFEKCKRNTGASPNIGIGVSHQLQVPAMAGVFKPTVLIPAWCEAEVTNQELEMVITHELIHIRRRDGLIQVLAYLISAIHWFNPLTRIAVRYVESARELSCDQQVVKVLGSSSSSVERIYGELILNIATRADAKPVCAVFLGGFIGTNNCLIKQRIAMLIQTKSKRKFGAVVAAMATVMLVAIGYTAAQTVVSPSTQQESNAPQAQSSIESPTPQESEAQLVPKPLSKLYAKPSLELLNEIEVLSGAAVSFRNCKTPPKFKVKDPTIAELVFVEDTGLELNGLREGETSFEITEPTGDITKYQVRVVPRPPIQVMRRASKRIEFLYQVPEIMVEDPEVASAIPTSSKSILVTGIKFGNSTLVVSNPNGGQETLSIEVIPNIKAIEKGIAKAFAESKIKVDAIRGSVILSGFCKSEKAPKIAEWVKNNFEITDVVNQCFDTHNIAIKVKIYEVSKKKMADLGINWSIASKKEGKKFKTIAEIIAAVSNKQKAVGQNLSFGVVEGASFNPFIEALERNAIAKLLDQPVLVANPGKPVDFLSGGEVPIPVTDKDGSKSIEFRAFGTKLNMTPTPVGKDDLTIQIEAELSELADDLATKDGVPGFRVRRMNTGVQMKYGETLALVGEYRSKESLKGETEVLFLITPRKITSVAQKTIPTIK